MQTGYWENLQPFVEAEPLAGPTEFDRLRSVLAWTGGTV